MLQQICRIHRNLGAGVVVCDEIKDVSQMTNVPIDGSCLPCTRGLALSVVFEASYRCQNNELLTRGLQRTTQVKSFWRPSTAAGVHFACQLCV